MCEVAKETCVLFQCYTQQGRGSAAGYDRTSTSTSRGKVTTNARKDPGDDEPDRKLSYATGSH